MMKSLVAYFSAEAGTTRKVAEDLAGMVDADLWEIKPMTPYTPADLKWTNPLARCNREKIGKKDVPIEGTVENWDSYTIVYLGFPIWYFGAPNVIQSFCKGYDRLGRRSTSLPHPAEATLEKQQRSWNRSSRTERLRTPRG